MRDVRERFVQLGLRRLLLIISSKGLQQGAHDYEDGRSALLKDT